MNRVPTYRTHFSTYSHVNQELYLQSTVPTFLGIGSLSTIKYLYMESEIVILLPPIVYSLYL